MPRSIHGILLLAVVAFQYPAAASSAENPPFVPPARTITDISAILDREKPDEVETAKLKSLADSEPSRDMSSAALAEFYYERGHAQRDLGRAEGAIDDANKSVQYGRDSVSERRHYRLRNFQFLAYKGAGQYKQALDLCYKFLKDVDRPGFKGWQFSLFRHIIDLLVLLGDYEQAATYGQRMEALVVQSKSWERGQERRNTWMTDVEMARARLLGVKGRHRDEEVALNRAETYSERSERDSRDWDDASPLREYQVRTNSIIGFKAINKAKLGRLAEAESEARRSLLRQIETNGKYNVQNSVFLKRLAFVLVAQGRYEEAEKLFRTALEVETRIGAAFENPRIAQTIANLAGVLNRQRRYQDAATIYAQLDKMIEHWSPVHKQTVELNGDRIYMLLSTNNLDRGLGAAKALVQREKERVGETHFDAAVARGIFAIGLKASGRNEEALTEFRAIMPLLMAAPDARDYDDTLWVSARVDRVRTITEAYLSLAMRMGQGKVSGEETFPFADAARSQSVHRAVTAASARMLIRDGRLSIIARREQDEARELNAKASILNAALALPPEQRDDKIIVRLRSTIATARAAHETTRAELNAKFKGYFQLIAPKPEAVVDLQAALKDGEVILSFYFGERESFVWVVPKQGRITFALIPITANEIEDTVKVLRKAVAAPVADFNNIPPFDTALAYRLYEALLMPVEEGWKKAKTLFVVSNGALAQLPLALLPTEAPPQQTQTGITFGEYRAVKWLARTHATVTLPSAAALKTLRSLPPKSENRDPLIGFGDPYFSEQQAAAAEAYKTQPSNANELRSFRRSTADFRSVDSADLAKLPRLPETADELKAVAVALKADLTSLKLGRDANEKVVMTADLARYRVVAFATHGLVGGELNGLTQPALALTAPKVAGIDGDGLLTMDKIMSLKLDADWTVLSACNTGTGIGAEAEAASGLGRAFFYAGSRALLVTNWPVHSTSATELVSDLFRQQTNNPSISRAEALRQTIVAMIENSGYVIDGKMIFSYAHPLFWAPYTIMGDGGQ